jgi:hypothetical protein
VLEVSRCWLVNVEVNREEIKGVGMVDEEVSTHPSSSREYTSSSSSSSSSSLAPSRELRIISAIVQFVSVLEDVVTK